MQTSWQIAYAWLWSDLMSHRAQLEIDFNLVRAKWTNSTYSLAEIAELDLCLMQTSWQIVYAWLWSDLMSHRAQLKIDFNLVRVKWTNSTYSLAEIAELDLCWMQTSWQIVYAWLWSDLMSHRAQLEIDFNLVRVKWTNRTYSLAEIAELDLCWMQTSWQIVYAWLWSDLMSHRAQLKIDFNLVRVKWTNSTYSPAEIAKPTVNKRLIQLHHTEKLCLYYHLTLSNRIVIIFEYSTEKLWLN